MANPAEDKLASARESALASFENIKEMVETLEEASKSEDFDAEDEARERIYERPLSIQVRTGWYAPGGQGDPEEFEILLGTGGPAVRIIGGLDEWKQPETATLQCQDWFTPWTDVYLQPDDEDILKKFASVFYFGD